MKRFLSLFLYIFMLFFFLSCAPVLRQDIMKMAIRDVSLSDIKQSLEIYKGKLFMLGGIIIDTKATNEGSFIEALYIPVNSRGHLKGIGTTHSRFLALFPKENGFLDPLILRQEREVTIAGELIDTREGMIDDMEYVYPLFRIKELYLWEEKKEYFILPSYYEPYPYWWDYPYRWYRPYWWGHRFQPYYR